MTDWDEGLDFDEEPQIEGQDRYPPNLRHVLFVWTDGEEDLQFGALAWFIQWRKRNQFILDGPDKGYFVMPVADPRLWEALKGKIIEWAWLERGGLDLELAYCMLAKRHELRIKQRPVLPYPGKTGTKE
jgi:hypothetical protein